jgi:hypothetical protein
VPKLNKGTIGEKSANLVTLLMMDASHKKELPRPIEK